MLTCHARGKLRMANFVVCRFRFTNNFFCKIAARGPLIYWWYHWKRFAVNFYASCFDSSRNSIGEKLRRLYWENTIYRLLFTLANTLTPVSRMGKFHVVDACKNCGLIGRLSWFSWSNKDKVRYASFMLFSV